MSTPRRIQRKRTKGWRMPEGAVYVGRPSEWGNPFAAVATDDGWRVEQVGRPDRYWLVDGDDKTAALGLAVRVYRGEMGGFWNRHFREYARRELRGKDLACWCPLDQPCHADVLLEIANTATPTPTEAQDAPDEES